MKKLLVTIAVLMGVSPQIAAPVYAGGNVSSGVAVGEPYPQNHYEEYPRPDYGWDDDYHDEDDRISCEEGRGVLRDHGYRQIQASKCQGNTYRYQAFRRGKLWSVRVNAWSGDIVGRRVIGYY
jgi:hypothetical protein